MGEEYFNCICLPFQKQSELQGKHLETISMLAEHSDRNLSPRTVSLVAVFAGQVKPSHEVVQLHT